MATDPRPQGMSDEQWRAHTREHARSLQQRVREQLRERRQAGREG